MLQWDCVVIGAGPAGLTAAIYLARFRRSVLVIDNGLSRARLIPRSHNCPGFPEGVNGHDFLERLRTQAETNGVELTTGEVTALRKVAGIFQINTRERILFAHTVVLATGVEDKRMPLDNWDASVSKGIIRLCPICDAYDSKGQNVALISMPENIVRHAQFLRTYFKNVSAYLPHDVELSCADQKILDDSQLDIPFKKFKSISVQNDKPSIQCADESNYAYDSVYVMLGEARGIELAQRIGACCDDRGKLSIDEHQCSTVTGLYAIGDVVSQLHQVSVAIGQAAVAATHIHNSLARNFFDE